MVSEVGVAAVPGSSFYKSEKGKHKLRFTFLRRMKHYRRQLYGLKD